MVEHTSSSPILAKPYTFIDFDASNEDISLRFAMGDREINQMYKHASFMYVQVIHTKLKIDFKILKNVQLVMVYSF